MNYTEREKFYYWTGVPLWSPVAYSSVCASSTT